MNWFSMAPSFALDADGQLVRQAPAWVEDVMLVWVNAGRIVPGEIVGELLLEEMVYAALKLGVRDYLGKNGFPGAIIGLSGGVDSALTLAVAVDALGADKVARRDDAIALHGADEP